MQNLM